MRKRRLLYNTAAAFMQEITALICGFILPHFFMHFYGSAVNGLIASITNFLGFISFLDFGVGAVVQSALYQPLAEENQDEISRVISSAYKFFRNIAKLLLAYIILLLLVYPGFVKSDFNFFYVAALIVALGAGSFAQYYFGVANQLLLNADQKTYVVALLQTVTVILNTIMCVFLMKRGCSIQLVKFVTVVIFLLRPVGMWLYVKKNYNINRNIEYSVEPIRQKWNGFAQHIAAVVLENTDTAVLTCFSMLEDVSVYSVYYMITNGIRRLVEKFSVGMQSLLGNLYAKKENSKLLDVFHTFEMITHMAIAFLYSCTAVLIVPFVKVYTKGITDVNYTVKYFPIILVMAQAVYCLRIPYNMMVRAAGHYKETQVSAIVEAVINISVSVAAVMYYGLTGVALGTLLAMLFRTTYLAYYSVRRILVQNLSSFIRNICADLFIAAVTGIVSQNIKMENITYESWALMAVKVVFTCAVITLAVEMILNRKIVFSVKRYLQKDNRGNHL